MATGSKDPLPPHLSPGREIHVVISILSGRHQAQEHYDTEVKPLLDSYGIEYRTHTTTSAKSIITLTKSLFLMNATKGVKQTIILLSGDGGVVDIVDTLTGILNRGHTSIFFKPAIVLIPMGTANALAWSSKVAQDPLKVMMTGTPKPLPSFQVHFSPGARLVTDEGQDREALAEKEEDESVMYGAVVFSWGLHASLVAMSDTTEYRQHGIKRFGMAAEQLLKDEHVYKGRIKWRNGGSEQVEIPTNEHSYILAVLVSNLEEHFQISPATEPVDGALRLVYIGSEPGSEIMRILGLAYQAGKHVEDPKVVYEDIESLRIEFEEDDEQFRLVCVDGKIVAVARGGWAEVTRLPGTGVEARRVVDLVC
ncbi:ATP-NAD kinase-like domain-containing protein [Exophiala viscosa]|uniref:ATP-NAD kinase-like domain-containing protein n=1 Tax=Exophiala viscosa TaxID=2486360 RepID=UPI0021947FB9|nr:ATP-NAD kinase-like domain-containing protein [Exophiala viscosa]